MTRRTWNRVDEDWLRHHGIGLYSRQEEEGAFESFLGAYAGYAAAREKLSTACDEAAEALNGFGAVLMALDVEVDLEAATLLDAAIVGSGEPHE